MGVLDSSRRSTPKAQSTAIAPVSVITPCYRCSETIERAIASIAGQTLRPMEIIVVDDRSDDGTLDVLQRLEAEHEPGWIRIVALDANGGPSAARNRAWDLARGDYVAFLDADDSWHPRKVELQYGWMVKHPDVVLTGTRWAIRPRQLEQIAGDFPKVTPISRRKLLLHNWFCTSGVMVRREMAGRFDETKSRCEDYLLWLELAKDDRPMARLNHALAIYHKSSFGESGLSSNVWKMQAGQVDTYVRLWRAGSISAASTAFLVGVSTVKFARRLAIVLARRLIGR